MVLLLGLWREVAPHVRHEPGAYFLRALRPPNTAEVSPAEGLHTGANLGGEVARKLLWDLAYRSCQLEEELVKLRIVLITDEGRTR